MQSGMISSNESRSTPLQTLSYDPPYPVFNIASQGDPVAFQAIIFDLLQKPRCSNHFLASSLPKVEIVELDEFKLWLPDRSNDVYKLLSLADGAN